MRYVYWEGQTDTTSQVLTHTYTNAAGCDSTHTLSVTIYNSYNEVDTHTACDSFTWIDGITYTSSNNTADSLYQSINGCDSLVTLNLTIILHYIIRLQLLIVILILGQLMELLYTTEWYSYSC